MASRSHIMCMNTATIKPAFKNMNIRMSAQRNVQIVYAVGFATVPDDLSAALQVQVRKAYSEWLAGKKGMDILKSQSVEGWMQTFVARGLDPWVADVLSSYQSAGV